MIIRTYKEEDLDAVISLWERCQFNLDEHDLELVIERKVAHDATLFLVAEVSGEVIGTLMGSYNGESGTGTCLAVHPEYRRRGIANALITRLEKKLMALGCPKISFQCKRSYFSLSGMFENLDYVDEPVLLLEKSLTSKKPVDE